MGYSFSCLLSIIAVIIPREGAPLGGPCGRFIMEDTKGWEDEGTVRGVTVWAGSDLLRILLPSHDHDTEHSLGPSPVPPPPCCQPWWCWTLPLEGLQEQLGLLGCLCQIQNRKDPQGLWGGSEGLPGQLAAQMSRDGAGESYKRGIRCFG